VVSYLFDGDTIEVNGSAGTARVRVLGVNAPEITHDGTPVQCYGPESITRARAVVLGQPVTLTVKRGQRRTLGAVKVGLPTVPVLMVVDHTTEAERITKQWHENERRDALTDTDRLAAVEQLTILGVPAGSIAKRIGTPRKMVDAAVTANGSDVAKAAAAKHALTLTDAALIAEFKTTRASSRTSSARSRTGTAPSTSPNAPGTPETASRPTTRQPPRSPRPGCR